MISVYEGVVVGALLIALFFLPQQLPKLAKSIGKSKQAFQDALESNGEDHDDEQGTTE